MNKIKFIIATLAIGVIGGAVFFGCKKNEEDNHQLIEKSLFADNNSESYGILHNEITEYIIKKEISLIDCDTLKYQKGINNIYRTMDLGIEYCKINNYINGNEDAYKIREYLYNFVNKYGENNDHSARIITDLYESEDFFVHVLREAGFSNNMIQTQLLIRKTAYPSNCTSIEMDHLYDKILSQNPYDLNNEELFKIKILRDVTRYSRVFWNGDSKKLKENTPINSNQPGRNPNLPSWVKDCAEWTIYMDALGTVIGSPLGIVGSAIVSTTFSIGAKRDCECDGKYK
jgi:hypothetical protein